MATVLIADDEKDILELLRYNLQKEGYTVLAARNGREALELARQTPSLIILDIMMPEMNGIEVLKQLQRDSKTASIPVMFLTAKGGESDEVVGLELGASDYLVKPLSIPKLLARVRNVMRQQDARAVTGNENREIVMGGLSINPAKYRVTIDGREVFFPRKEFEVLLYLATHPGRVIGREALLTAIWGSDVYVVERTVDVHIRKIREKLGEHADLIETIKGVGYRLREEQ